MTKKQLKKVLRRLDEVEAQIDQLREQEKRVVDLVVALTAEQVGRMLEQLRAGFDEKKLVDAITKTVAKDVERMMTRNQLDPERLISEIAQRVGAAQS